MPRSIYICIVICFFAFSIHAQLSVSTSSNAGTLVNNIVGAGVQVTNVTLNCNGAASGTFNSNGTNLGISSGIILATGAVTEAIGPNNSHGGESGCFNISESFFDQNLLGIEPLARFDGCALEFDIKPVCNTLNINYVFASEEYPEWVDQNQNDAFGFFVWGPNPGGGTYTGTNVAIVPGTNVPVTIDNINASSFSQYYVNNSGGSSIEYDGFTTPLVASVNVSPCSIYHLKLVIADAGDCEYSSAVFLTNKGLTCTQSEIPQISTSSTAISCGNDGTATVNVTGYSNPITYNWQPSGQTTATAANLGVGTYTCTLGFSLPCPYTQTVSVNLNGNNVLTLNTSSTNSYCNNPTGTATANISGGITPYSSIIWNTIPPQNTPTINSLVPGTYSITVSDATGCTITKPVVVNNTTPSININESILNSTCGSQNGAITLTTINGGTLPFAYSWNTSPVTTTQNLVDKPAGVYELTITDADGCTKIESFSINNIDSITISTTSINEYCNQGNGEIHSKVLHGVAPYTWTWSHDATLDDSVALGLIAGVYTYTVTDNVGCTSRGNATLTNISDLFTGEIYTRPLEPIINTDFLLGIDLPSNWDVSKIVLSDGSSRLNEMEVTLNYPEYGYYDALFYVISESGCKDTIEYSIFVKDFMTIYIPNTFTPNGDVRNNEWYVYGTLFKEIKIFVYNKWGQKLFETSDINEGWDGTYHGKMCQEDVYIYKVIALDYFDQEEEFVGHIHLIR